MIIQTHGRTAADTPAVERLLANLPTGKFSVRKLLRDKLLVSGWIAVVVSFALFCFPLAGDFSEEKFFGFFVFHFAVAIFYTLAQWGFKSARVESNRIHYQMVKLVLLLISAYALNRELEVFADSPFWFCIVLVASCINYIAAPFAMHGRSWLRCALFFLQGISFMVFLYLSLYLVPIYIVSFVGMLFLGISVHSYVPLLFCYYSLKLARKTAGGNQVYWRSFAAGILAAVTVAVVFSWSWNRSVHQLNETYRQAMARGNDQLPLWVQVAQKQEPSAIAEKILKTNLVYLSPNWTRNLLWNVPARNFGDEKKLHDPLVVIASFFSGKLMVPEEDRIQILKSQDEARHQALERFWNGEHLRTNDVTTLVRVWPGYRMAYTEKTITVANDADRGSWVRTEEAVYTFHLPEGGVVTSLSLWIGGREEKAILTTKEKAMTAYSTIVSHESRDPSVIEWQEGNTVSVRVFPVVAGYSRSFKIGVTAPLRKEGDQLFYDNIWFQGPGDFQLNEKVNLDMASSPQSFENTAGFTRNEKNSFTRSARYSAQWHIAFRDPGLQGDTFSFNGYHYSVAPYAMQRVPFDLQTIYLDISKAWTAPELNTVWEAVKDKNVFVYDGEWKRLKKDNGSHVLRGLLAQQFSLFPFHLLPDAAHALVISKTGAYSPDISDLDSSAFLKGLQSRLPSSGRIRVFHIGNDWSPYLRTLKEFRMFDFESGEVDDVKKVIASQTFAKDQESDSEVIVHAAQLAILKSSGDVKSTAPDHLMRLFAYNHIMQRLGSGMLNGSNADSTIIKEAQEAYVVSPVSSLVVLEKKSDYDRFHIKSDGESLKNASLKNTGAVPEPAEWVMIILASAFFIFFLLTRKLF